jgi:hypothetical protein
MFKVLKPVTYPEEMKHSSLRTLNFKLLRASLISSFSPRGY